MEALEKSRTDIEEAISLLMKIRKEHPHQVALSYQLAKLHAQSGDFEAAASWIDEAVKDGWSFRSVTEADQSFAVALKDSGSFRDRVALIPDEQFKWMPSMGFKRDKFWSPNGSVNSAPDQGRSFFLSTVLAVTRNQGCSEREALAALKRNAVVDGTHPIGTFYFADTSDIRNKTRQPHYADAIKALELLGFDTRVIKDVVPIKRNDVLGLTMGSGRFNWETGGSTVLAGAICDNLTSHGGMLNRPSQTKCTEFMVAGAAGASGTVIEPYAIQAKFPHPMIHAHYARGCTLAEAFYQSVHGPFQLLIVGDALCQPFARSPQFKCEGVEPENVISGAVEIGLDFSSSPIDCLGY